MLMTLILNQYNKNRPNSETNGLKKKPTLFNINALKDTHILHISYDDLIDL